ncbi:DUF4065 domain-containing protein [bacterium]|nr:DUF4065 domain-containing protein [bacterium]
MDKFYIQLGSRIKEMRVARDFSQEEFSEILKIKRSTLSMIEQGRRMLKAEELKNIAEIFNVSTDILLDLNKEPIVILEKDNKKKIQTKKQIRINVPQKNIAKFKEIFLYILNKIAGKENIGESVLYKILYFIDFDFYEKYEEQLIGVTYMKNKYGPTPIEFAKVVKKMIEDKEINQMETKYFKYPQTKYFPLRSPNLKILMAHEIKLIDRVLSRLSDMNAKQISSYSHKDIPWLTTDDGEQIDYEKVFYRTPEYSVRDYSQSDEA